VRNPQDFLPLTQAVFHILLALVDSERHGYGIMQEIAALTEGNFNILPGTLYTSLQRMVQEGLIEESRTRPDPAFDDERRRYYRLTDLGRRVAAAEVQRLLGLIAVAQHKRLLGGPQPAS
jgi:DNA-binding PadR family transcriptional regulator